MEELEITVQQEDFDIVIIIETCDLHNCGAPMDGYEPFRGDRQGRRDNGAAL